MGSSHKCSYQNCLFHQQIVLNQKLIFIFLPFTMDSRMFPTRIPDENPCLNFTLRKTHFVSMLWSNWSILKSNWTEVMILTVVNICSIIFDKSLLQGLKCSLWCHPIGLVSPLRFVQKICSAPHTKMCIQLSKPPKMKGI